MIEQDDKNKRSKFAGDNTDNHKWADRVASDRQQGLEKVGLVVVAFVVVVAILLSFL